MDAVSDPLIEEVVVMKSAQVGWTEIINNIAGYFIDQDPAPIMVMQPTLEMAEGWSTDRLAPMVRDSPRLAAKIADAKSRDSGNKLLQKRFPGGQLVIVGANSPASLASRPMRVILADEVDRYPASAGVEGDPLTLAYKRTNNFWNRRKLAGSTPTIAGSSRIEAKFDESDKRFFFVPCPHCDEHQVLKWEQVRWEKTKSGAHRADADYADFVEPGLIENLPFGADIKFANPPGVDGYVDFAKISVRTFATGMNLPYDIFGDLEAVNFSSGRIGRIAYNRQLDSWTWNMLIPQFCEPAGRWFLRAAALTGRNIDGCEFVWTPPRREMLDLATEGPAIRDMVRSGLMDPETAIRERGENPDTVMAAWKRWADKADAAGLIFDCDPRHVTQVGNATQNGATAPATPPKKG